MTGSELRAPIEDTEAAGSSDPRVRRTRSRLMAALVELAARVDLDDITIGELTDAAGVNRATFYLHYSDKEALLLDAIDAVTAAISTGAAAATGEELDDADHAPLHTLAFFAELDRQAALYRRVLGPTGSPAVVARLRDGMQTIIAGEIRRRAPGMIDDRATERRAAFVAGGVLAAAIHWLGDEDREPVVDEAAEVWRMAVSAAMPRPHGSTADTR